MTDPDPIAIEQTAPRLLELLQSLELDIRDAVLAACAEQSTEQLAAVAKDTPGDTIYAIDRVSEEVLLARFERDAAAVGGVALVAEGLDDGVCVLPSGTAEAAARWRVIVDPIDGTRGLMYQKRAAWVLAAAAPNRGAETELGDACMAVQTEIPTLKQHLCDQLWAVRGRGVVARRQDRLTGSWRPLSLQPSRADTLRHGYAMVSRFFPGARDELAAIDEEIMLGALGPSPDGKALCFEDQYPSTGGQLYELMVGHDRFNADLRPLLGPLLTARGLPVGLCCHPYDIATALIAEELGVILTDPAGEPLRIPMTVDGDVAWVGYANASLRALIEPVLLAALSRRGLIEPSSR